jgi:hypothetical protein
VTIAEDVAEIFEEAQVLGRRPLWRAELEYGKARRLGGAINFERERERDRRPPVSRREHGLRYRRKVDALLRELRDSRPRHVVEPIPCVRSTCPGCGGVIEHRPGNFRPIHLGRCEVAA